MADGDWDKALRLLDKSLRFKPDNNVRTPAQVVQAYPTAHGRFILGWLPLSEPTHGFSVLQLGGGYPAPCE